MKKLLFLFLGLALFVCALAPISACAEQSSPSVTAKEAILVSEDGQVLFERNSTEKRPIASMTKIMTLLCAYDAIDSGKIALTDDVVVSKRASSMGGSQVFLDANATYKLENLLKSIVICSANDSCVAVAEHIDGSVENFVENMNAKANELNLQATYFENCTGLPAVSQFSCAKDVAKMLASLIKHQHYFECAKIWMEDFVHPGGRVTGMTNTNKLVRFYDGCDGGKTGFTNEAQHCLAATAKRGNTRVIAVVVGATDSKTRFAEVSNMFNYAFANYQTKVYCAKGQSVGNVEVLGGKTTQVEVTVEQNLQAFGKKGADNYQVKTYLEDNVKAPFDAGTVVGRAILVDDNGQQIACVNLVTASAVEQMSYWDYLNKIVTNS